MRVVMAKTAIDRLAQDGAMSVAQWTIAHLRKRVDGLGGIVLLDRDGQVGYAFNTPRMAFAYMHEGLGEPMLGI